jgi:catechol 2,3-dioxygenase-like lactoylglutathione lyase family enzyme
MTVETEPIVVTEKGEATGLLTGYNHIQIIVHDMSEALVFYRDILGLKVVRTYGHFSSTEFPDAPAIERNYYLEFGNHELLILLEIPSAPRPDPSVFFPSLWPGVGSPPVGASKVDHMAFNVPTQERLDWFHDRLVSYGIPVSDVIGRGGSKLTTSIYFFDPSGNAMEIATFDKGEGVQPEQSIWLDTNPVPELLADD